MLLLDTAKSTTSTYSEPIQVTNDVIHSNSRQPKDNPLPHYFTHVIDVSFTDQSHIEQDHFVMKLSDDMVEPMSPAPSICSDSIGESVRSLSPANTLDDDDYDSWCKGFRCLTSNLTYYAEELESVSVEILSIEGKVRELMLLEKSLAEKYEQEEKIYIAKLEEYNQVSERQLTLIQHLADLNRDITKSTTATTNSSSTEIDVRHVNLEQSHRNTSNQLMHANSMEDKLFALRCEFGLLLGGSVGTGHVVHSFEGPLSGGLEYIIAGSGTISKDTTPSHHQSRTIQHIGFHKHKYMLHINQYDRDRKFTLLSRQFWMPDDQADQCQFYSCDTRFTFFNRRHHCRRCGILVCQRHSLNRLPLFSKEEAKDKKSQWYRICDSCFYDLIILKNTRDSALRLSDLS